MEKIKLRTRRLLPCLTLPALITIAIVGCATLPSDNEETFDAAVYELPGIKVYELNDSILRGGTNLYYDEGKNTVFVMKENLMVNVITEKAEKVDRYKTLETAVWLHPDAETIRSQCTGKRVLCKFSPEGFFYAKRILNLKTYESKPVQLIDIRGMDADGLQQLANIINDEFFGRHVASVTGNNEGVFGSDYYADIESDDIFRNAYKHSDAAFAETSAKELRRRGGMQNRLAALLITRSGKDMESVKQQLQQGESSDNVLAYITRNLNMDKGVDRQFALEMVSKLGPYLDKEKTLSKYRYSDRMSQIVNGAKNDPLGSLREVSGYQKRGERGMDLKNTKYAAGLIWQDSPANTGKEDTMVQLAGWTYCSRLEQNGITDWHLPFPADVKALFEEYPNTNQLFDHVSDSEGYPTVSSISCNTKGSCATYFGAKKSFGLKGLPIETVGNVRCVTTTNSVHKMRDVLASKIDAPTDFKSAIDAFDQTKSERFIAQASEFAKGEAELSVLESKLADYIGWPYLFSIDSNLIMQGEGAVGEVGNSLASFIAKADQLEFEYSISPKNVDGFNFKHGNYAAELVIDMSIIYTGGNTLISVNENIDREYRIPIKLNEENNWSPSGKESLGQLFSGTQASLLGFDIKTKISGIDNNISIANIELEN